MKTIKINEIHVGKYTVRPMDASYGLYKTTKTPGVLWQNLSAPKHFGESNAGVVKRGITSTSKSHRKWTPGVHLEKSLEISLNH